MSRITTVIFDMFNTLVHDGENYWDASFQRIVKEQGLHIRPEKLREAWALGDRAFREQRTQDGAPFQTYSEAWTDSFSRVFSSLQLDGDAEGALQIVLEDMGGRPIHWETVGALRGLQDRWRIAILSNADDSFLFPVVDRLGFHFELVLSSEEARCYKPRPQLFQEALGRLGVKPSEAAYVGDRQLEDVQGAKEAGMRSVWINRDNLSPDPNLATADHVVTNLLQIPHVIGPTA